ncbi:MAG: hypothetical protein R2762_14405 [Bryobacteraceae bacterium]
MPPAGETLMRFAALILLPAIAIAQPQPRTSFQVRYVAADAVYLDGGRDAGLAEGFRLVVRRLKPGAPDLSAPPIAELIVVSIAATSAVCEVRSAQSPLAVGDTAFLNAEDAELLKMLHASRTARKYAQVVSFTEGDPIEEEAREYVPRPPLPEINRVRGRIGFEHNSISDHITRGPATSQQGVVLRADMTRIGGSYWNFTGYWRGRFTSRSRSASTDTISNLINRTYHIGFYYNNPNSRYTAGFGRLLVPWASSLSTIDGGYFARRLNRHATTGVFAGSTPDPTAWNYNPNRQLAGSFLNFEAGNFERLRYTGTTGLAISRLGWKAEREYAFFENSLMYKSTLSLFHNMEVDRRTRGRFDSNVSGAVISRSFFTARYQPARFLSLDLNHNYFRGIPTFDTRLLGTGLLDQLLFQGLSAGARFDFPGGVSFYGTLGRNRRDTEQRASWNHMAGITVRDVGGSGIRVDARRSRFDSSFGTGEYYTVSFVRNLTDRLRVESQIGKQTFQSPLSDQRRAIFFATNADWLFGDHYFIGLGHAMYRGRVQNYDQIYGNVGYRF